MAKETKKKTAKKGSKTEPLLLKVPEDKKFFCADGSVFSDIKELYNALNKMKKETFTYHVNSEKNDFSSWIYDVIGDTKLADDLRKSTDKKTIAKKIKNRLDYVMKESKL